MSNLATLSFNNIDLDVVDRNGQRWVLGQQIGQALGYKDGSSIARIFSRNSDEFTDEMTTTVKLTDPKNVLQAQRIFSPRGAHLISMFSRTDKAKAFRKWVLDVLDVATKQPAIESTTITPSQQRAIQEAVAELAHTNKAYGKYYGAIKTHFHIAKYDQLPADALEEALQVLQGVVIEQKAIAPTSATPEAVTIPDDMLLVNRMSFNALQNRVNLIHERYDAIAEVERDIFNAREATDKAYKSALKFHEITSDTVREAKMLANTLTNYERTISNPEKGAKI